MNSSESFVSRALTNDTEPAKVNSSLSEKSCLIKKLVTEDIIVRRSQYLKPKCRVRKISSKAAVLVLIWNSLGNCVFGSMDNFIDLFDLKEETFPNVFPFTVLVIVAVFSGWIADTYLGHYRTAKIGFVLLFVASVLQSVLVIVKYSSTEEYSLGLRVGLVVPTVSLGYGSAAILLVTLPQIGLDQLPDSSSTNITSFIAWFVFSVFAGFWIGDFPTTVVTICVGEDNIMATVWTLFPAICMLIVLISDFFLTQKWLIIEPKAPKSLKTIYRVLKFASKHKSPVNRSALTYWEEDIPSRIDLGKIKYGGPYTIEQVEDVKTLLQILALTTPLWISLTSFNMYGNTMSLADFNATVLDEQCSSQVTQYFTYEWYLVAMVLIIVHELVIYPLFGHITTSSIRRIGAATVLNAILNVLCIFLSIYYYYTNYIPVFVAYGHTFSVALIGLLMLTALVEFVSAQSPYNMRGVLLGYVWCIYSFTYAIAILVYYMTLDSESKGLLLLVHTVVSALLSLIGLVSFGLLARWYTGRVRDDVTTPHMWVEEVYDRYLS